MQASGSGVVCRKCGELMVAGDVLAYPGGQGPDLEFFACESPGCQRKAAVMFEPERARTDEENTWVERAVAQRGAFFPHEFSGSTRSRFNR
jgi:hypothetical protein